MTEDPGIGAGRAGFIEAGFGFIKIIPCRGNKCKSSGLGKLWTGKELGGFKGQKEHQEVLSKRWGEGYEFRLR